MNVNIPKIIHFCWFGKGPKPDIFEICLESWKKYCPDFEIRLWNEENSDLGHPFVKKCYHLKKWAFVSDFVRLQALYEHGGIYLDIDMLLLKNLDSLLKESCFFGAESDDHISCGIIGSRKYDPFIKSCLQLYDNLQASSFDRWYQIAIPILITDHFKNKFRYNGLFDEIVIRDGIKILPKTYFYAVPNLKKEISAEDIYEYSTKNSIAVHLWLGSWMEESEFNLLKQRKYIRALKKITRAVFIEKKGTGSYFRKILSSFKQSLKPS